MIIIVVVRNEIENSSSTPEPTEQRFDWRSIKQGSSCGEHYFIIHTLKNLICKSYYSDCFESPLAVRCCTIFHGSPTHGTNCVNFSFLSQWLLNQHPPILYGGDVDYENWKKKYAKFKSLWIFEEILQTLQKLLNLLTCIKWI